jgi:hypothetical protein
LPEDAADVDDPRDRIGSALHDQDLTRRWKVTVVAAALVAVALAGR